MDKIGIIGLGNIAQKAYLPVMAGLQDEFEWHLTTRDLAKGEKLQHRFGFSHLHQTLDQLIAQKPLAVFIHTPTATHAAIIEQLLEAGINVYVDKPVSDDLDDVKRLYQLASSKGLMLTCGFNRRFAPFNQELAQIPNKKSITVEKTRESVDQTPKDAIFDLAIHSVDTALFLLGDQMILNAESRILTKGNYLDQFYLTIDTKNTRATVITNMHSGINLEQATVQGSNQREVVTDLSKAEIFHSGSVEQKSRPDWENTLISRGFEPLINKFLRAVVDDGKNPVSPESSILSHEMCLK
ncbi:Gfo/Idh/MocA family protein [Companilactobacillus furfuricola]|uniref:Gfo/Idh/MocA family protein n=1 Tax=Companilactobacillus furfuricola TaxID=1462575 RepID=UPI000F78F31D|nr:Gfo/Idh/MocA family oxidoreductase [Companilactobacillus furfuricola]